MWHIAPASLSCLRVFALDLVEGSVVGLVALANPHLLLYTCDDAGQLTAYSVEGGALVRQSRKGFKSALTCVTASRVKQGDSTVLGLMIAGVNGTLFVDDSMHVLTGLEAIEAPEEEGLGATGNKASLRSRALPALRPGSSSARPNTASSILSKPTAQANAEKVKDITIDLRGQGPKAPQRSPESRRQVNDLSALALSPEKADFDGSGSAGRPDGGFDLFKSQVVVAPDSSFQPFGNAAAAFSGMPGGSPPKRVPAATPTVARVGEDETGALKMAIGGGGGGGATAGVAPKTNQPRRMRGAMSAKSSRIFDMRREMAKNR